MVSIKEKMAYGLGDTASNIVFQTVMLFLTFFYTDIFGISPAFVGTMFLVVRIIDAITDPLMGAFADRTQSKHGKFRPYLLWFALPFGVISVLAFTTPDFSETGKMIYAFVTYTLLMMVYTAINIPYCALGASLTDDPKERVSVQTYRFIFAFIGGVLVSACTLPLVEYFGQGDKAKGYQLTILAMSILGVMMFLVCFYGTKERVIPPKEQTGTYLQNFKTLWQNDQWRVLALATLCLMSGFVLRTTLAIYYIKYYLNMPDSISLIITLGMFGSIIGCIVANQLAKKFCKVKLYITIQLLAATLCAASFFVPAEQAILAIALYVLWNMVFNTGTPLLWAKMADTVDYGQWKTGIRTTGMVYSSIVFFIKLGIAVGGATAGWLLAGYGYQADVAQTDATKAGLLLSFSLFPAIGSVLVAVIMRWYMLNNDKITTITQELKHAPE
ncbi:glycoside-pentoside-hexuronide (GPH):cation symporter [Rheinheimera baltica]|uniref:Glycoside-pentoside-hexuronide (GPH):cation symporter n=1 Tax=Rheinheimera baltica TaxID=67576 RepID=A0ABT9I1I8_9GAMM|nr:glycoside-pentoside-hexuronide (GPH):cation symporter [Rheinheimera baltica]MDP5137249.1 glycoside-pentoside-hexuronide (GPH):cation symporter [Rheinheimera baltica]MDP5143713.1 glycoside-pentoside-hexuronide (GPH):cation symporter [Rheinheimera baltica]MDP5150922.1 glycoside-pentoside-hexuronide (GPH):cation symporter [Rheinheimera baltica]MDP5188510.1 glycoside-pentoside-hexuronide (GPH):cation symporter [Rheinheimera baltica]